jgi:hypothetical protein
MSSSALWHRFQEHFVAYEDLGFSLDISRMRFADDFLERMEPEVRRAFVAMDQLEAGAIANPDEKRMVGHYWLRDSQLAPNEQLRTDIEATNSRIKHFAADVLEGKITAANGERFRNLLLIGIGGSALGPQFVADALSAPGSGLRTTSSTIPIPMASTASSRSSATGLPPRWSSSSRSRAARRRRATACSRRRRVSLRQGSISRSTPSP